MRRWLILGCTAAIAACSPAGSAKDAPGLDAPLAETSAGSIPVMLKAADGVSVYGRYSRAKTPKALILLFHQAGSSKQEYETIAPRLNAAGYDTLAIDQRSGGGLFGNNETAAALGHPADYLEAKGDLQAAIEWAKKKNLPTALWGSSYSSSLAFLVAAENVADVKAVLAFSPGEYFDDKTLVARAAAKLAVPVYVSVASGTEEATTAKPIVDAVTGEKTFYVPDVGIHGSSTLIAARDPAGSAANWRAVLGFLSQTFG